MKELILELKERVKTGGEISYEEALMLAEVTEEVNIDQLREAAHELTIHFHQNKPSLCSLVNAKSYLCGEDCRFCAQSVHYQTLTERYGLIGIDEIAEAGKKAEAAGTRHFCIVTSGAALEEDEFEKVTEAVKRLRAETALEIDASIGHLSLERVKRLKEAGLRRVNNNVQCSHAFYPKIVSTHSYEDRLETLRNLREGGLEICAGGILGMGESREDRIQMAFELKAFQPECFPVNILNPRPGTPLERMPRLDLQEIIKTIAIYRFILPKSVIKLAGGREFN